MTPDSLDAQIIRDEGTRLFPYLDCCGRYWRECTCIKKGDLTIGNGRNLDSTGILRQECDLLRANDIASKTAEVRRWMPFAASFDPIRLEALVNMAFNMGVGGILNKNPKAVAAMQAGDWQRVHDELLGDEWERQVGDRARRIARQFLTGERQ